MACIWCWQQPVSFLWDAAAERNSGWSAENQDMIRINPVYLNTLLKMTGITYIVEFASGICKDAGYQTIAGQIETFAKLTILALGMPVLTALLETVREFLS